MTIKPKTTLTWKERIIAVTSGRNSKGGFLWYSHDKICSLIGEAEGLRVKDSRRSLTAYLHGLVQSGHLERAAKPPGLRQGLRAMSPSPEYLYRQTGKPYTRGKPGRVSGKNEHEASVVSNAFLSHELWRVHRRLPKWFRRMMLD